MKSNLTMKFPLHEAILKDDSYFSGVTVEKGHPGLSDFSVMKWIEAMYSPGAVTLMIVS